MEDGILIGFPQQENKTKEVIYNMASLDYSNHPGGVGSLGTDLEIHSRDSGVPLAAPAATVNNPPADSPFVAPDAQPYVAKAQATLAVAVQPVQVVVNGAPVAPGVLIRMANPA